MTVRNAGRNPTIYAENSGKTLPTTLVFRKQRGDSGALRLTRKSSSDGDSDRVSLGIVLVCVAAVLGSSAVLLVANASLVADGSFYLLWAIKHGQPCACASGRQGINLVREGPLLLAVHQGVTNTHLLTLLEGIGFLIFPALVWTLAIVHARNSRFRFFFVAISFGLCYATMIFFSVGELTLALPLVVLASVLLTQPTPWSGGRAGLAIVSTGLLFFSHEAIALSAVLLAVLAVVRMRADLESTDVRASIVVLVLSIAVLGAAVWTVVFWPNPNSNTFINFPDSAVFLFIGGFCLIGWALLYRRAFTLGRLRWALLILAVPFTLYGIHLAVQEGPLSAYFTRGPSLVLIAALQLLLLVDWIIRRSGLESTNWTVQLSSHASLGAAVFLVALMTIPIVCALRWSTVIADFRQTITHQKGFVPETSISTSAGSSYLWSWTNATMSVILRSSSTNAVVENTSMDPLYPFSIGSAQQQISAVFRWDRLGVLASSLPTTTRMLVPSDGATVSGEQVLDAVASADLTDIRFELTGRTLKNYVISKGTPTLDGWIGHWNTSTVPNGTYQLKSVATRSNHVSVGSASITVTVSNTPTTP